jgi:predicted nicotinamide N-methyase
MTVDFVRSATRLTAPPLVPEVRLHLADEAFGLWEATDRLPYWAFAWSGGQALARYVLDDPARFRGRAVLDLGTGGGIVAIAAAKAGAASVLANDVDPFALAALEVNARSNGVAVTAVPDDLLDQEPSTVDVVLAGDVFYDRTMARRVLPFLLRSAEAGADVLVGDPGRAYLPARFEPVVSYPVAGSGQVEDRDVTLARVWRLPRC